MDTDKFSDGERLGHARHFVRMCILDCVGAAILAVWVAAGCFDEALIPDIPGFMQLAVFVLGFAAVFAPYSLYRAVRDLNRIRGNGQ